MPSLNQGAWVPGTDEYRFGYNSIPTIPITGAPADTNFARCAMLHDGLDYRFYAFRGSTRDSLYQFAWNGSSYAYGYRSIPQLRLVGMPADADASSIRMLHSGSAYHAYLRRLGDPTTLYQFIWRPGTDEYAWDVPPFLSTLHVEGFPADTDWSRWNMLHDGTDYRIYAFAYGSIDRFFQGAWDAAASRYRYGFNSIPQLRATGYPADSDPGRTAMLHDGAAYRLYFLTP